MSIITRISGAAVLVRKWSVRSAFALGMVMIFAGWSGISFAEKLVDPSTVAPEYRAVAEKRRAEQIKLFECSRKADAAKILRRDRAAFVSECLDK
jgi:hypothetical protein